MEFKKILFLGLGGAGQRHLRILKDVYPNAEFMAYRQTSKTPLLNPDFTVNTNDTVENFYSLSMFTDLDKALANKPDLTVISTPTSTHTELVTKALEVGSNILVEKPFNSNLDGFDKVEELAVKNNLRVFTSFQRREHPHFQKIKQLIGGGELGSVSSVIFNVSSHVPDWHKYEDFKDLYACRSDLGGGVLLTEIHETDLATWFFGKPETVYCQGGNYSEHSLDVEDTANMTLTYTGFNVQLNLSFMQKKTRRELYIHGSKRSVEWNEDKNELTIYNHKDNSSETIPSDFNMNDMFISQAKGFLKQDGGFNTSDIIKAKLTVEIVEAAKTSIKENKAVFLGGGNK